MKRVSVVNKDGSVNWKMCEVTTLACPAARPGHRADSNDCLYTEKGGANKRARIFMNDENNQLDLSTTVKEGNDDLPLDSNISRLGAD